jgi:alpha-tubulin suppressor-like RCC1 family protein
MTNNTFKSSEIDFEDRFVKWEELGLDKPTVTPRALWVWGTGNGGTLGLNSSGNLLIDTQTRVGSLTDWKQVSGNSSATLSVKTNGTLWSWGFGALGLNDTTSRSSPVQVGTDTNWKFIEAGQGFVHAIRTSGALWVWGTQAVVSLQGVLGLNDNSNRSSPIQVGTSTDWKQVSSGQDHSVAVKTNGTLWGWGQQPTGTLGLNNLTARSSPTQIGASADWKLISVGSDTNAPASGASFAIKTNGTLWS